MEVSNRLKRKAEEKNELKRSITELKNAQEEEETEVDTATYVSSRTRITYVHGTCLQFQIDIFWYVMEMM